LNLRSVVLTLFFVLDRSELVDDVIEYWVKATFVSLRIVEHLTEAIYVFLGVKIKLEDLSLALVAQRRTAADELGLLT
jgi:predicted S18 family serine protease